MSYIIGRGSAYCDVAAAFFNRLATPPTTAWAQRYDVLARTLVNCEAWSHFDWIHIDAAADRTTAKINFVSPSYPLTEVNAAGLAWAENRGFTSDGATGYLTGPNLSTFGGLFSRDSAHMGVCVGTSVQETNYDCGNSSSFIRSKSAATTMSARANDGTTTAVTISPATAIGHTMWSRNEAGSYTVYKNGILIGTPGVTSTPIANEVFGVCARGNGSLFSTKQIQIDHGGDGQLTAAQIAQVASGFATLLQSIGASTS